jgi:hypothetical protein
VTQVAIGTGVLAGVTSALIGASSSQGAWSSINQFQLYLYIPLIGAFIHEDLLMFLEGFSFALFNFAFVPLTKIPGLSSILNLLSSELNEGYVNNIGIEYESTTKNIASLLAISAFLLSLHLSLVLPLFIKSKKYDQTHKFRIYSEKLFFLFTFNIYVRMFLESYIVISLSTLFQIWDNDHIEGPLILTVAILCGLSHLLLTYYSFTHPNLEEKYFKEFFGGIKPNMGSKLYFSVFISRRLF